MNGTKSASISVIIPIWREGETLLSLVPNLKSWRQIREVIVSAAEPVFDLRRQLEEAGAIFLDNPKPNRGRQLNEGARIATGDWLLFQHADTELCREHVEALAALNESDVVGGAFYRAFDERHPHLRFLEPLERWHSRAFGTVYGDQSIFVRREQFLRIGVDALKCRSWKMSTFQEGCEPPAKLSCSTHRYAAAREHRLLGGRGESRCVT